MGHFYRDHLKVAATPELVEAHLHTINAETLAGRYRVERVSGVPTTPEDDRVAMWAFWLPDWDVDAAFTMSLLADNRMEYKVPRSQWDEWWQEQQRVRKALRQRCKP